MAVEVKVPVLPESVSDATVAVWHKKPGDTVQRDENLVDLETDKVMLEVPAPEAGVLKEILKEAGSTVAAGELIALFDTGAVSAAPAAPAAAASASAAPAAAAPAPASAASAGSGDLSPAVRRLVAEHDVDPQQLTGTGKRGRITPGDVTTPATPATNSAPAVAAGQRIEERVPMTRLRARIAERLVQAQHTAAILTTFNEVDMKPVMDLRARYKEAFEKKHGVRLGFMSFFVRAAVEALKRYPVVNASIDKKDIVYHSYFDIGVAVSTERGLVVPILRDADTLGLADIESQINDFGSRAQQGKLSIEEMTGGTFTVSNGGVFGSLLSTPILNPPQSGILGMHKIEQRPVVVDGDIVVRPMMYLAFTYDHRIIDGKESVTFLKTIKEVLEDPARILLDI